MSFAGLRFVLALGFAMAAAALPIGEQAYQSEFVSFVTAFDKRYSTAEFFQRFAIFKHNYDTIVRHNSGNHSWTMGVNQFSDLTDAEFAARLTSPLSRGPREQSATTHEAPVRVRELAGEKDWRKEGAVTPVKNMGDCSAQWAFAATGLVEGWVYTQKNVLYSFSEQQLFDCSQVYGTLGCQFGWPDAALQYLRDEFVYDKNGACLSSEYPFTGKIGTCKTCRAVGQFSVLKELRSSSALFDAAIEKAPVAFALAFPAQLKNYKSGIFSGDCPGAVGGFLLLVGYGTESGTDYWIAKNAWGPSWGEQGFVRFRRRVNICGMESWGWTITQ